MEQIHVLEHHGNIGKQTVAGQLFDIVAADTDVSAVYIIKTCDQAADRCFSGTRRSDDRGRSLFRYLKAYIL